ncbi:MAG: D-2-hydroxyacid dehydrogenase family protein [Candidatus Dormibacteraeota bacterium]|nr:D-2-hydroxyacid dehydrogenase family protein [Candidatus Dormibacteraeota bacterium]
MTTRVAVLDDYQGAAEGDPHWRGLPEGVEAVFFPDHLRDEAAVAERLRAFEVVVAMRERTPFPASLLGRLPNLRLLVTTGMRNRSIDLAAAQERGIVVCGTEGTARRSTAELAWGLILAATRRISAEERAVREGRWQTTVGTELAGKRLGLLGLGRIGTQMAGIGRAFEMEVVAWSQNLTPEAASAAGATRVEKEELLATSDVVSIHLVLSERTRALIGARELASMRPTAYLINTSRGPIVEEAALVDALRRGLIAGAGLDVFDEEPLPLDHPLRSLPNAVITPHLGYVTQETYAEFFAGVVDAITQWLDGTPVRQLMP